MLACFAIAGAAAAGANVAPFSPAAPGAALPGEWRRVTLPRVPAGEAMLVADVAGTVLQVRAVAAAGSVAHALDADAGEARLAWRWKIDRVVRGADMGRKEGDDYAARVYVTFDLPLGDLPFATRARIRLGRLLFGAELPTAALCYVWDNRHPEGHAAWNAYSSQVRMVVVRSGDARAGEWIAESRDIAADFRAAFGRAGGALPRISGVALSADTDQTGESVTAWFGDVTLGSAR